MPEGASPTQQWMDKYLMQLPVETVKGLLGIGPTDESEIGKPIKDRSVGTNANLFMQAIAAGVPLLKAGLPFAAIMRDKPVFHGTPKVFENFDPTRNDVSDVLGWMTHFAEDPEYANRYAATTIKHGEVPKNKIRSNIIPAIPQAQNVLDLVNPNADDMSQVLASLEPSDRAYLINRFKYVRRLSNTGSTGANEARYMLDAKHYPDTVDLDPKELAVRYIADKLRLNPETFKKSPFDAIRYRDVGNKSWAIPETTPIKSKYGAPLNDPPKSLKILKGTEPSSGTLTVDPDRWKNTPLSLPETPYTEAYKINSSNLQNLSSHDKAQIKLKFLKKYNYGAITWDEFKNELDKKGIDIDHPLEGLDK